ncbi:MAG: LysM peptidoglycan-binding domain-containing protein [Chloroflexi bacterium]|nr:LysM peptidoglycan-binding domain-containing protein [Chloroflexota bacterium]
MTKKAILLFVLVALLLMPAAITHGDGEVWHTHTVTSGQTLSYIASLYRISLSQLRQANGLRSDMIVTGQTLEIPLSAPLVAYRIGVGDTLSSVARRYGVSVWQIQAVNGMGTSTIVYHGQTLYLPPSVVPTPAPSASPIPTQPPATRVPTRSFTATPAKPVVQEAIVITSPVLNSRVKSPLVVTGWGSGYENRLSVKVLDEDGKSLGGGSVTVDAPFGQYGIFSGTITFRAPTKAEVLRVQVYSTSPRDGAIEHLNSVLVKYQP